MMKKTGKVFYKEIYAGTIEQSEGEYRFTYDDKFLNHPHAHAISFTLPLRKEPYKDKTLIPFFDGLIPEGWLLHIAEKNWKIDPKDRMSLLLTICEDCIGAVKIKDASTNEV